MDLSTNKALHYPPSFFSKANTSIDINIKLLFNAVKSGQEKTVRILLSEGTDVNASDGYGTPLHYAARNGAVQMTRLLLAYGANMYTQDRQGHTPWEGATKNVQAIFRCCQQLCDAARKNHLAAVKSLLQAGAIVNISDSYGGTPLHYAARNSAVQMTRLLLAYGANMYTQDRQGHTPWEGATPEIMVVFESYQRIKKICDAAKAGKLEIIQALLNTGTDVNISDFSRRTPLHHAVQNNQSEAVNLLLLYGADMYAQDANGNTPWNTVGRETIKVLQLHQKQQQLCDAAQAGRQKEVSDLLAQDINVNAFHRPKGPLHYAIENAHKEVVSILLAHNAEVNSRTHISCGALTPLHYAIRHNHLDMVKLLLKHGADTEIKTGDDNKTPMDLAAALDKESKKAILKCLGKAKSSRRHLDEDRPSGCILC